MDYDGWPHRGEDALVAVVNNIDGADLINPCLLLTEVQHGSEQDDGDGQEEEQHAQRLHTPSQPFFEFIKIFETFEMEKQNCIK